MDWSQPPKLWAPSKPAIIRAASLRDINPAVLASFLPGMAGAAGGFGAAASYTPPSTSYANAGGSGDRSAGPPTVSQSGLTLAGGSDLQNWVNGSSSGGTYVGSGFGAGDTVTFDFGVGALKYIDGIDFKRGSAYTGGIHTLRGSLDNSNWTDITTSGGLDWNTGATTDPKTFSHIVPAAWRHYQLLATGGAWQNGDGIEFEFRIG